MKHFILLLTFLFSITLTAQTMRETRAVWVSTNFRLDWPPKSYSEAEQKKALIRIFNNIEKKNLNTVYFQVRSNGTVLFRSSQELFSPYITGNIGEFGNYDPLEFAIEEAHRRGLEIHAWINTNRIYSGDNISIKNNPLHISQLHPEWVYKKGDGSIWLNPGIPEVREYLVELINEIVQNYDVDGIQLDFIRYPLAPIEDYESYKVYGNGKTISEWRRENITKFITLLNNRIKGTNSKIKLGVTPIGIYKSISKGRGMEGYSDVYQDTRTWLKKGIIDYAVPQIYWDARSNPKFDVLAKDWIDNSYGKNIIIGIAAYKPEVLNEIEREINITRNLGAAGMAFFRYGNIANKQLYSFNEKALPTEMPWIEKIPELAKLNLIPKFVDNKLTIFFEINKENISNNGYFALYEHEQKAEISQTTEGKLIKVVPNYINHLSFSLAIPTKINYYYSAIQFDQLWNESSKESNIINITIPKLKEIITGIKPTEAPILLQQMGKSTILLFSNSNDKITLYKNAKVSKGSKLSTHFLKRGYNKIILNYDLSKYGKVLINFKKNRRSVTLTNI